MQFAFLNSNKYAAINAFKACIAIVIAYLVGSFFRSYIWYRANVFMDVCYRYGCNVDAT